jgi:hypothetical protein
VIAGSLTVAAPGEPRERGLRALRLAFVLSTALLALLALATVASPLILPVLRHEQTSLPEAGKIQVLVKPDEWVLQYNLLNPTEAAGVYIFELTASAPLHSTSVLVEGGRTYIFIYHLRPEEVTGGAVRFALHRGGESTPVEDLTLRLPPRGGSR